MKAETLLSITKNCVLCLFLCVPLMLRAQSKDTSRVSLAVRADIVQLAKSLEKESESGKVQLSGDSSIIQYIPSYYLQSTTGPTYHLAGLIASQNGTLITLSYGVFHSYGDLESGYVTSSVIDTDSLMRTSLTVTQNEEESFWDDTLQPILVTAGAAAVIALFFFVSF